MTFTIDKPGFYKTRDGRKVEVIATALREPSHPLLGYVEDYNNTDNWTVDGYLYSKDSPCRHDIVSEWRDPVKYSVDMYLGANPHGGDGGTLADLLFGYYCGWARTPVGDVTRKFRITVEEVVE
jgi:hypothetical protein